MGSHQSAGVGGRGAPGLMVQKAAGAGGASGLAMALGEYLYLSITVQQFSGPGELVLFAAAMVGLYSALGAMVGSLLGIATWFFWDVGRRVRKCAERRRSPTLLAPSTGPAESPKESESAKNSERREQSETVLRDAASGRTVLGRLVRSRLVRGLGLVCCVILFLVLLLLDALAYHRLYFRYHLGLEAVEFLVGMAAALLFGRFIVGKKKLAPRVVQRLRYLSAGLLILVFFAGVLLSEKVVEDENLRMLVSDRGLVSAKFFVLARSMADRDSDGYAAGPFGYDCDDSNPDRHPMAYDRPGDGLDQDCTGRDRAMPRALPAPPLHGLGPQRIYLITVDAVRLDAWLDLAGKGLLPTLWTLTRRGAFFLDAHAPASWTIPSIHSMMTGRYPSAFPWVAAVIDVRDRVALLHMNDPFAKNRQNAKKFIPAPAQDKSSTLAEQLSLRGYVTVTVQDTLMFKKEMGMARGFRIIDDSPYKTVNMSLTAVTSPAMVRRALNDILAHRDERLFFYMHLGDPHAPYRLHRETPPASRSAWDRYLGEIRFVDLWLGRFFSELDRNGMLRGSLLIIAADHGEEFREHGGRFHATTVYEEVLHVPLLLVGPGIRPGLYRQLVTLADVFPTVLSFADGVCGRDLASSRDLCPLVTQGRTNVVWPKRVVYAETRRFFNRLQTVIGQRYKLIRDDAAGASALFDIERDPGETRNVIGRHRERAAGLIQAMNRILDAP